MKRSIIRVSYLLLGVLILTCLCISSVEASFWPSDSGERCWQVDGGGILKLFVTNMGKKHYIVNGMLIEPGGNIEPINGNAEILGDNIYMTTTSAGGDSFTTWTFIGRGVLDKATLDGTIEIMGVSQNIGEPDPHLDYDGPFALTNTQCPKAVNLTSPNGGETLISNSMHTIMWDTYTTETVAKVILKYTKNGGTTWEKIATLTNNTGSHGWVPTVGKTKSKCKVMVILKDAKGNILGKDTSDGYFTIQPAF